jgi:hypothetical protein
MSRDVGPRVIAGFVCAPFVVGLVTFLFWLLSYVAGYPLFGMAAALQPVRVASATAIVAVVVGMLITAIVAVPAFVWMMRRGRLSLGRVSLAGAAIGVGFYLATILAISLTDARHRGLMRSLNQLFENVPRRAAVSVCLALIGMITAAMFWLIAIRGSALDHTDGTSDSFP